MDEDNDQIGWANSSAIGPAKTWPGVYPQVLIFTHLLELHSVKTNCSCVPTCNCSQICRTRKSVQAKAQSGQDSVGEWSVCECVYVYMCAYLCGWLGVGHNSNKPDG